MVLPHQLQAVLHRPCDHLPRGSHCVLQLSDIWDAQPLKEAEGLTAECCEVKMKITIAVGSVWRDRLIRRGLVADAAADWIPAECVCRLGEPGYMYKNR